MTVAWIQSFTGKQVFPLDPRPEQIDPRDIAHALSMVCRYTGHVIRFYSVAEHSVRVAEYLLAHAACPVPEDCDRNVRLARYGLLHDASEAYICDIARPLKETEGFAAYCEAEARLQGMIYDMHGLTDPEPAEVQHADLVMLSTERMELLGPAPDSWGELPPPLPVQGFGWDPTYAEAMFLQAYNALFPRR